MLCYTLPPVELVRDALAELARIAQLAGDTANANALNRADAQVAQGVYAAVRVSADGSLLVPSRETAGTVYRVGPLPCSCTAGANGRPCWHAALAEAVGVAREQVADALDAAAALIAAAEAAIVAGRCTLDDAAYAELVAGWWDLPDGRNDGEAGTWVHWGHTPLARATVRLSDADREIDALFA
jgi:hypothetical protein